MNWYKIAQNFLKQPSNIEKAIEEIYSMLMDFREKHPRTVLMYEHQLLGTIQLHNPYLNIFVPVDINVWVDRLNTNAGEAWTDIYKYIKNVKKDFKIENASVETERITDLSGKERDVHTLVFSYEDEDEDDGQIYEIESYININLAHHIKKWNVERLKKTIRHEIMHIIDPKVIYDRHYKNYKEDYGGYLNDPTEYNSRMNQLQLEITNMVEKMSVTSPNIINDYLKQIQFGNLSIINDIKSYYSDDFGTYYLQDPQMKKTVGLQISKLLLRLLEQQKSKQTQQKAQPQYATNKKDMNRYKTAQIKTIKQEIVDNIEYKLFIGERGYSIRVLDIDSNEVVTIKCYGNDEAKANKAFETAIIDAKRVI